jgi:hypothetical protein
MKPGKLLAFESAAEEVGSMLDGIDRDGGKILLLLLLLFKDGIGE